MLPTSGRNGTEVQFFGEHQTVPQGFRSGVSLHSHSMYSEESLEMLPEYVARVPLLRGALTAVVDCTSVFWTPPLAPRQAYRVEEKQIQRRLGLPALVSLTDHDDIRAGSLLRVLDRFHSAPISVEWTVPFGATFFHLGVHNIPAAHASAAMQRMRAFTAAPSKQAFIEELAFIAGCGETLVVVNHPLWDEKHVGESIHRATLADLLSSCKPYIHALEVNGLRDLPENSEVLTMGRTLGLPVVAGGDRHGCEPNAILNLSHENTFAGFVQEIRRDKKSHVTFMPQYRYSLSWRTMQTVVDVLRDYPGHVKGRRYFMDRVFCKLPDASVVPLSSLWRDRSTPRLFTAVRVAAQMMQRNSIRRFTRMAMTGALAAETKAL